MKSKLDPLLFRCRVLRDTTPASLVLLLAAAALPAVAWRWLGFAGVDDSHITFFAADRLAAHGVIQNYNAEPIEQSSALAFVILLAVLRAVTRAPVPLLGYAASLASGAAAVLLGYRLTQSMVPRWRLFAAFATASAPCLLIWSTSGMESSLAAAAAPALVLTAGRYSKEPSRAAFIGLSLAAFLFAAVRPENIVILVCAAIALPIAAWRNHPRIVWRLAAILLFVPAAICSWRLLSFGQSWPQPVLAKAGGFAVKKGARYLWQSALANNPAMFLLACGGIAAGVVRWLRRKIEPIAALASAILFAQLAFIVGSGGDWMTSARFLVPSVPLAAALAAGLLRPLKWFGVVVATGVLALGFSQTWSRVRATRGRVLTSADAVALTDEYPELRHRFSRPEIMAHVRDVKLIATLLHWIDVLAPRSHNPLWMMSGQAGMVPYYAVLHQPERVRFIDLYGLTSRRATGCAAVPQNNRSSYGTLISGEGVLAGRFARCGVPRPAIVFSDAIGPRALLSLREKGYAIVYQQSGRPVSTIGDQTGYIAIREDLLTPEERTTRFFRWTPVR